MAKTRAKTSKVNVKNATCKSKSVFMKSKLRPDTHHLSLNEKDVKRISKSKLGRITNQGEFVYNVPSDRDPKKIYNITQKTEGNQIKMTCDCIKQFIPNGERTFCKHITTVVSKIFIGFKDGIIPNKKKSMEQLIDKLAIF